MNKQESLNELEQLEGQLAGNNTTQAAQVEGQQVETTSRPNVMDGYVKIDRDELPQHGVLYPESWQFAYRCPTAKEVANFSTINEQDQPGIVTAIEDLIRKCVVIYDIENDRQINTGEICDGHRTFFLLKLRDFYLPSTPVKFRTLCQTCHNSWETELTANKLVYPELKEKLINTYDGRIFTLDMGLEKPIVFRVPTIETSSKIFKYIVKTYRAAGNNEQEKKDDKIVYDKQFLLVAPYLFETGRETIRDITYKYKFIQKNDEYFKAFLTIVNKLKLDNEETFTDVCPECGSEEETLIKFPGGWKKLFISDTDTTGYFD